MLLVLCVYICYTDLLQRKIFNSSVAIVFLFGLYLSNQNLSSIFLSLGICFLIGILLIVAPIWGGGDSKLLIALSPLFTPMQLPDFFIATLLCGGVLSVIYWIKYRMIFKKAIDVGLPYGVAIVCGAILSLYFSQGLTSYS
ncbi:prepilin peptidase [Vibrio breoganii]|uniref:A24 family peptidase n=1 Tax=Vibrio breoganii TaxID=553239 RepID=UPI001F0FA7B1|nr:prepilin peptidase [Vibrio breoganii]